MDTFALRYHRHGPAHEVLQAETLPLQKPVAGEVLLRTLAAPINPSDLGCIAGTYGDLPVLPAVAGREGVAEVLEITSTGSLQPGQRVLLPEGVGSWQNVGIVEAKHLTPVPDGVAVEQAAMATINPPTAVLLLDTSATLRAGDWIIQNAANSAVGHYVIQLCRHRGIRTINLVRRTELEEPLRAAGADAVLLESPDVAAQVKEITSGHLPRLALNSVGGHSAVNLLKCLAHGGTMVTFGGMTTDPVRFPTRYLIFNDVRLIGFWLHRWKKENSPDKVGDLMGQVLRLLGDGILHAPVEKTYTLGEWRAALDHAARPGRAGKVLFRGA